MQTNFEILLGDHLGPQKLSRILLELRILNPNELWFSLTKSISSLADSAPRFGDIPKDSPALSGFAPFVFSGGGGASYSVFAEEAMKLFSCHRHPQVPCVPFHEMQGRVFHGPYALLLSVPL